MTAIVNTEHGSKSKSKGFFVNIHISKKNNFNKSRLLQLNKTMSSWLWVFSLEIKNGGLSLMLVHLFFGHVFRQQNYRFEVAQNAVSNLVTKHYNDWIDYEYRNENRWIAEFNRGKIITGTV